MSDFRTTILEAKALDPSKRVRYTTGLVLGVDEFLQEQTHFMERDHRHHRALHGYGTVLGLQVYRHAEEGVPEVVVTPGMAVDPQGRSICVPAAQCAKLNDWLAGQQQAIQEAWGSVPPVVSAFVVLCYRACETDKVPVPGGPCRSQEDSTTASRIADRFELKLVLRRPPGTGDGGTEEEPPPHVEERAIRRFGALLARIELTDDPGGTLSEHEVAEHVRGLAAEVSDTSPPSGSPPSGSPPESEPLRLYRGAAASILRTAFRVWVTEVRPRLLGAGRCAAAAPHDDCVLLAELQLSVTQSGGRLSVDDAGPGESITVLEETRPYLLSTRLLQEVLAPWLSTLEGGALPPGGGPGGGFGSPPGDGAGMPGEASPPAEHIAEADLTRVAALSWQHAENSDGFIEVERQDGTMNSGLVVAFGKESLGDGGGVHVQPGSLDEDSFQVLLHKADGRGFWLMRGVRPTRIIPVAPEVGGDGLIVRAREVDGPVAEAGAFLVDDRTLDRIGSQRVWVVLSGDFVLDETGSRVIDAEHLRGRLPTGDRRRGGRLGIQGGRFESWFFRIAERLDLNTATEAQLRELPRIGPELAERIVTHREAEGPFTVVDDLADVTGIGDWLVDFLRPFVFVSR